MTVEAFKADLSRLSPGQLVDRWLMTGSCEVIDDATLHKLGEAIATHFTIEYRDVVVVGSAKLGFSIKPSRRYKDFGEESDIDVAIVSRNLFERVWKDVYLYDYSGADWSAKGNFRKYLSRGWIRPDLLPPSDVFAFANDWWQFFNSVGKGVCPYKIAAGIYHSDYFLRQYQLRCIEQCKQEQ